MDRLLVIIMIIIMIIIMMISAYWAPINTFHSNFWVNTHWPSPIMHTGGRYYLTSVPVTTVSQQEAGRECGRGQSSYTRHLRHTQTGRHPTVAMAMAITTTATRLGRTGAVGGC